MRLNVCAVTFCSCAITTPVDSAMLRGCAGEPPRLVAVPTHFFKAVLAEKRGEDGAERALVGAWVLPNAPVRSLSLISGQPVEQRAQC